MNISTPSDWEPAHRVSDAGEMTDREYVSIMRGIDAPEAIERYRRLKAFDTLAKAMGDGWLQDALDVEFDDAWEPIRAAIETSANNVLDDEQAAADFASDESWPHVARYHPRERQTVKSITDLHERIARLASIIGGLPLIVETTDD